MLRCTLPTALLLALLAARPAASVLTDDEPSNDLIGTAAVQIVPTAAVTTDAGEFTLIPDDIDYVGIGNLSNGDIVTVSTTPLVDVDFETPDTFIGLFTSGGSRECENDDILNNELSNPVAAGLGSLCNGTNEAAMFPFHLDELGERRGNTEPLRIGGIDSADQGLDDSLVGLPAESSRGEFCETFLFAVASGRNKSFPRHAEFSKGRK